MISVEQALERVLAHCVPRPPVLTPLSDACGRVLAEDVVSDIDSPPHDKSLVDGYAVRAADVAEPGCHLTVLEEVTAGVIPTREVTAGTTTRVMTGVAIPRGADAVVMLEETTQTDVATVQIKQGHVSTGAHIMPKATSLRRGQSVLKEGTPIRAIEIGVLAETGRAQVQVHPAPRVAVIATGNELVESRQVPAAGQIRNSNGPMLCALANRSGARVVDLGIGRDEAESLRALIEQGLDHDVLVLSGGVSAGVLDLVPGLLHDLGTQKIFHKVNLKPGKPLWFGVLPVEQDLYRLIFGLPGNPVSSLVCFILFVRPALMHLSGHATRGICTGRATMSCKHIQRGDRLTYYPAVRRSGVESTNPTVEPLPWRGSADLATLLAANCLIVFPPGNRTFSAGDEVDVVIL